MGRGMFGMPDSTSFSPSSGECRGFLSIGALAWVGWALIKDHGDVRTQGSLNLHTFFWSEESRGPIEMILELNALLSDLAGLGKGPDLEAPRVGENGAIPAGETMQSTQFADRFLSRPEPEMIRVSENNF